MKLRTALAAVILPAFIILGVACSGEGTADERRQFEQEVESRLQEIENEINDFRSGSLDGEDLGEEKQRRLNQLEEQRDALSRDLEELKNATEEEWRELRGRLDESLQDLRDSLEGL